MRIELEESQDLIPVTDAVQEARAWEIFQSCEDTVHVRTDRFFAGLLILQWIAAIAAAIFISPRAWVGLDNYIHPHVWAAVFLGALVSLVPAGIAIYAPGRVATRHLIAVCQMLMSALLIHLTGGRIETHFHVFGSLAFLAFYRDWRVLVSATVVVAADHLIRGAVWPESVYGTLTATPWRSFEHAGWVLFEDIFLIMAIRQSLRDMWRIALQKSTLEQAHEEVERRVRERTCELAETNKALSHEIGERARAEAEREELQRRFIETARRVGMAEIATSVLHNVGNVLTSVNVSATLASEKLRTLGVADLRRATALVEQHRHDLADFITTDERGRHLPEYLVALGRQMETQEESILTELRDLAQHIEHIKGVVAVQQTHAGALGMVEEVSLADVLEDAIRINSASIGRHGLAVIREYEPACRASVDKHKLLQLLVNVVSNAKYALIEAACENPTIIVRLRRQNDAFVIEIEDNGMGIAAENLDRIFEHGFTTRQEGHGFGLHSAALAAQDLGGTLAGLSPGLGQGAQFRLELPANQSQGELACSQAATQTSRAS